ncbi:leishmanolysin family protein, putative, partial [Ichthyophthirius multifiliis]
MGVPNSDLHLYIIYSDSNSQVIADAGCCAVAEVGDPRPIFGRVNFYLTNMNKSIGNSETFQYDLKTTIHEFLHILGFAGEIMRFWIDPDTGDFYGDNFENKLLKKKLYRGKQVNILTSKNVLEVTRKYYNCPTAEGMQLENDDNVRLNTSHWERTVIYNEIMTGTQLYTQTAFSIFTIALLKDTGFYPEVNENMTNNIFWGKGKGCDFLVNACQSTIEYPEYPKIYDKEQCMFEYEGIGVGVAEVYADKCPIIYFYQNRLCTNTNSVSKEDDKNQEQDKLSNYSTQSKCFQSTATQSSSKIQYKSEYRCHQYKCSSDASEISVIFPDIDLKVLCGKGEQNIQKDIDPSGQKARGKLTCPQDYERLCNYTSICPNFCSLRGVCVNGQCICKAGFGGVDCSINCSGVVDNETCIQGTCPQGKYLNPDNTCKSDCPLGSFGRADKCEPCDSSCSRCTGPSATECTKCQFMTLLQGNQCCLSECPFGFYKNQETQACEKLSLGCIQQNNLNTCLQCDTANGFRLGLDQKCTLCYQLCSLCNPNRLTQCFVCEGSKLVSIDGSCVDECPEASYYSDRRKKCQECSIGCQKCNYIGCNQCYDGYYVYYENRYCQRCVYKYLNCQSCDYYQCNKCMDGYQLNSTKRECKAISSGGSTGEITETQCSEGCKQCSQSGECLYCKAGFYQDQESKSCVKCRTKFKNCNKCTKTNCNRCATGFQQDQNQKQCIQNPITSENTGIECPQECKNCSQFGQCIECQDGFYDYSVDNPSIKNIKCLSCTIKFKHCSQCTSLRCLECLPGYQYYDYEDLCIRVIEVNNTIVCNKGCTSCNYNGMCFKCLDSFYQDYIYIQFFKYKVCFECINKFSNCLICDQIQCTKCNNGYHLNDSTKQCETIPPSRFLIQTQDGNQQQ